MEETCADANAYDGCPACVYEELRAFAPRYGWAQLWEVFVCFPISTIDKRLAKTLAELAALPEDDVPLATWCGRGPQDLDVQALGALLAARDTVVAPCAHVQSVLAATARMSSYATFKHTGKFALERRFALERPHIKVPSTPSKRSEGSHLSHLRTFLLPCFAPKSPTTVANANATEARVQPH
mmetsp:Transcript_15684/g.47436  ORF Transcript_15684/g.47436 Transcript_15684/m.47436 type:complete len:183 (+) Transcript_15684:329-877(+)